MGWKDTSLGKWASSKKQDRTPEERALVRRLDLFLMTFGFASQGNYLLVHLDYPGNKHLTWFTVIKYLDQTNIKNAYISGMKEDVGLFGNELNLSVWLIQLDVW